MGGGGEKLPVQKPCKDEPHGGKDLGGGGDPFQINKALSVQHNGRSLCARLWKPRSQVEKQAER